MSSSLHNAVLCFALGLFAVCLQGCGSSSEPSPAPLPPGPSKSADFITGPLPGFPQHPFNAYSGFLNVTGPVAGYDRLIIHYQFDHSQGSPDKDPLVVWHTGGPGGSSIYGDYGEMGWWGVSNSGTEPNPWSWNRVANMLYLESPAGAYLSPLSQHSGFSYCMKDGKRMDTCQWDDKTQAQAYALTLQQFFSDFPEFAKHSLYLVGESYAGQYIPNIAHHILTEGKAAAEGSGLANLRKQLQGIAVGNGCWGGGKDSTMCNGPNEDRDMLALYFGNGLVSSKLRDEAKKVCKFPDLAFDSVEPALLSKECNTIMEQVDAAVGPHDPFNMYNNCPNDDSHSWGPGQIRLWHEHSGKSTRWLNKYLDANRFNPAASAELAAMGGGYNWTCGQFVALPRYFARADVRKALHLPEKSLTSAFVYNSSGPASVTLYPEIARQIRVLIYNGQIDSRVPYIGNEQWTTGLASRGVLSEVDAWHPWYQNEQASVPAGYVTTYSVTHPQPKLFTSAVEANDNATFSFATFRMAGHEVPHYVPEAAFVAISHWLAGEKLPDRAESKSVSVVV